MIHPDLSRSTEDPTLIEKEAEVHSILDNSISRSQIDSHHVDVKAAHLMNDGYLSSNVLETSQQVGRHQGCGLGKKKDAFCWRNSF